MFGVISAHGLMPMIKLNDLLSPEGKQPVIVKVYAVCKIGPPDMPLTQTKPLTGSMLTLRKSFIAAIGVQSISQTQVGAASVQVSGVATTFGVNGMLRQTSSHQRLQKPLETLPAFIAVIVGLFFQHQSSTCHKMLWDISLPYSGQTEYDHFPPLPPPLLASRVLSLHDQVLVVIVAPVEAKSILLFFGALAKMQFLLSWIDQIPGALKALV